MKTYLLIFTTLLTVFLTGNAGIGQTPRVAAAIKRIPTDGKVTSDFAPPGWEINNEAADDLNGDTVADAVITLTLPIDEAKKLSEDSRGEYEAAPSIIVVLLGDPRGGFRRFAINGRLYPDDSDYRSYLVSSIAKGVLSININWGDYQASEITYRFRYERSSGKLMLIGFDSERYDRTNISTGFRSSENYLTGWRIDQAKSVHQFSSSYTETRRTKIGPLPVSFEKAHFVVDENAEYKPF